MGIIHNAYSCVQEESVPRLMFTHALQKKMYSSEKVIFLQWDQFLSSWNKLFLLKIIFANQSFKPKLQVKIPLI